MNSIGKHLKVYKTYIQHNSFIFLLLSFYLLSVNIANTKNINYVGLDFENIDSLNTYNLDTNIINTNILDTSNLKTAHDLLPKDTTNTNNFKYIKSEVGELLVSFETKSDINSESNLKTNLDNDTTLQSSNDQTIFNLDTNLTQNNEMIPISNKMNMLDYRYNNIQRYTVTGEMPNIKTDIKPLNLGIVLGSLTTIFILQHQAQANTIWKEKTSFRIHEDGRYAIYADKPGHVIGSYYTANTLTDALIMSGVDWESSVITSGILGLAYMTYIEILDGYGQNFGFSPTDMYANIFGAGLYVAQYYSPFLQNITPKYTYFPSNWFGERKRQPHDFFIDDYSSQTLWLTFNMHNLLPVSVAEYWPDWLDVSLGYAARNLTNAYDPENLYYHDPNVTFKDKEVEGDPKFIISLDYNLVKLLPDGGFFWNWVKQTLNFFKFPAPALEIGYDGKSRFSLIYPFPMKL